MKACVDSALQLGLPELALAGGRPSCSPRRRSQLGRHGDRPRSLRMCARARRADPAGTAERPCRRRGFEWEQGYNYPHDFPNHWVEQQYLPDTLKDLVYYE